MRLEGKVAVVTGAGKGIGKAIAQKFIEEGARVVVNDIISAAAEELVERFKDKGGDAIAVGADVSKRDQVEEMFEKAVKRYKKLDILVNSAGVRRDAEAHRMTEIEWDVVVDVLLKGSFNCAQVAQQYMVKQNYGKIVIVSSPWLATMGEKGQLNYSTASAGLQGFTRALAVELGKHNINVNCVAPDFIDTEMTRDSARRMGLYLSDFKKIALARIPLRRLGTPAEVADVVLFLVSDESSFITGQTIYVTGGA